MFLLNHGVKGSLIYKAFLCGLVFAGGVLFFYAENGHSQEPTSNTRNSEDSDKAKTAKEPAAPERSPHKAKPQPPAKKSPDLKKPKTSKKPKPKRSKRKIKNLKNLDHRELWYVDVVLWSIGTIATNKAGIGLGMNLWKWGSIEVEALRGSHKASLLGVELKELNETLMTARFRIFPTTKTFNIFGGWGRRDLEIRILDLDSTTAIQEGVEGGVGHRWTIGPLAIAMDWLTIWNPVRDARFSEDDVLTLGALEEESDKAEEQLEKLSKAPSVSVLKLSLGIQF